MKRLLGVDNEVLKYLAEYKIKHGGDSPSIRNILDNTSASSTSHVAYILDKLEKMRFIEIGKGDSRWIKVIDLVIFNHNLEDT